MKTLVLALSLVSASAAAGAFGAVTYAAPADQGLYAMGAERGAAFALWYGDGKSDGMVNVDYGRPAWQDGYDAMLESGRLDGQRWRLGKDFWTQLDTNLPLRFGTEEVEAGQYYLTLERSEDGIYTLQLNDPAPIRAAKLLSAMASRTEGGVQVEMLHDTVEKSADKLTLSMEVQDKASGSVHLIIHWGRHELRAPFSMLPEQD